MANSLLDFVMSLVRDPEAAARYAADPEQALAAANLTGVTSADVSNLIPVVTESLPVSGPLAGLGFDGADAVGNVAAGNVWASGAATAAFDAFDDPLPESVVDDGAAWTPSVIDATDPVAATELTDLTTQVSSLDDASLQLNSVIDDDVAIVDDAPLGDWTGVAAEVEPLDDTGPAFDFFD